MPDDQDDQQTADDQSTTESAESDQLTSQDETTDESAGQTTGDQSESDQTSDVQSTGDAGAAQTNDDCSGWFSDAESTSKRAAEFYVRNELTGDRGVVEKIDVFDRDDPESYSCNVHFSDKTTNIEVVVFRNEIIVREILPGISKRLTCWYDYRCPPPDRDLVLTKRRCTMMAPIILRLPSK
jgi:hypothetical protein